MNHKKRGATVIGFLFLGISFFLRTSLAIDFPGADPGQAEARNEPKDIITLSNRVLSYSWSVADRRLKPFAVADAITGKTISLENRELFTLELSDGRILQSSDMKIEEGEKKFPSTLKADPNASTYSHCFSGKQFELLLVSDRAGSSPPNECEIKAIWRAELRDGANAVRQILEIQPVKNEIFVRKIHFIEIPVEDVQPAGTVPGSPIVCGNLFFAFEHPNAAYTLDSDSARCILNLNVTLLPGQSFWLSSAAGVVPEGQLRRGFLYYVERERAHPYRPFLHYNAWYDICWADFKITEEQCLNVINLFGEELTQKRKVKLASFVWDDGWDDPQTLWRPLVKNFPNGFIKMREAAQSYNSTLGFWLSPFGGYGQPAEDRSKYGREQGFEFNGGKFALAGPKYYERFLETCSNLIRNGGANFFKFDGLTQDVSETQAMLRLTQALREIDPDLFISITTGTWPSPYWLWYGDSTWRGDGDMGFFGEGSKREQWITYRDMVTYKNVVIPAPLYPLNALMTQGIAQARYGYASELGNSRNEFRREVQSFFACGTNLQELYISPGKMTQDNWDDLAEAALWSQANSDVLVDAHWIGGDPGKGEIYGWASWSERKAILALRNPASKPASITIDIGKSFELPPNVNGKFRLKSPWKFDAENAAIPVTANEPQTFELQPFEVSVYDAVID